MTMENPGNNDSYPDQMLGKLALSYKLITSEQYLEAVGIQKKEWDEGRQTLLSDILFSHGFLSSDQIDRLHHAIRIMTLKRKEKRFGSIAVNRGYVRKEDLSRALEIQKKEKNEIGRILIEIGSLNQEQLKEILEIQKSTRISIPTLDELAELTREKSPYSTIPGDILTLNVSQDGLIAVVVLPADSHDISVQDILAFLDSNAVTSGRFSKEYIAACLESRALGISAFIASQGQKGKAPVAGPVTLHFTPRPLVLEKGKAPVIEKAIEGLLLAERTMTVQGVPRITVFGTVFEGNELEEHYFMNGPGARMNETRDRITAACDGEPFVYPDGSVGVLTEQRVEHLDGTQGPFSFEGHIRVAGSVGPGADIRAIHITAPRVEGAHIRAEGDLWVDEQLVDSTVMVYGTLRADTIKNCRISCFGDVVSEHDIIDSEIETSGRCICGSAIVSAAVKTGMGVVVEDVISSDVRPSVIEFGQQVVPSVFSGDNAKIKTLETTIASLVEQIHSTESMMAITGKIIRNIEGDIKRDENELALLESTLDRMEQKGQRKIISGRNKILALNNEITSARDTSRILGDDSIHLMEKMGALKKTLRIKMTEYKETKGDMERKTATMKKQLASVSGTAQVLVLGTLDQKTVLKGPHREEVVEKPLSRVQIRETPEPQGTYALDIRSL